MASAVLANQNESSWVHMGKIPYSNPHLNSNPYPNPNPNPKKKQKRFHHHATLNGVSRYHNVNSPAVTLTADNDAYSFNKTSTSRNAVNYGAYLTFNITSYTKSELLELRKRLSSELDQIRDLQNRIESGQFSVNNVNTNPRSQGKSKKLSENKRPGAPFGSIKDLKRLCNNGFDNGDFVMENAVNFEGLLKECRQILTRLMKHKKGWIFNVPVDAVALGLRDYHQIVKRPMDLGTVKANFAKNLYPTPAEFAADVRLTFNNALLYNPKADPVHGLAELLLERFDELFRSIQEKMGCNISPAREREFREIQTDDELQFNVNEELQGSSWNNNYNQIRASPLRGKKAKQKFSPVSVPPALKKADRMQMSMSMQAHSSASTPSNPPSLPLNQQPVILEQPLSSPVRDPHLPVEDQKVGRGGIVKLPKPRAKDPNKREMNMEEKQKLGIGLQSLPQEKMPQLVHIIRKRNEHLAQDGDEIELDIEALDTETLWELDRFVTNWKKLVSKTKRQVLMMNNNPAAGVATPTTPTTDADMGAMSDKNDSGKKPKENDDEDVDIDDDMPTTSFPPVEIEKDEGGVGSGHGHDHDHDHDRNLGNASSSSSSSSGSSCDSSSSSDSESGSDSGSDSDADDAQS